MPHDGICAGAGRKAGPYRTPSVCRQPADRSRQVFHNPDPEDKAAGKTEYFSLLQKEGYTYPTAPFSAPMGLYLWGRKRLFHIEMISRRVIGIAPNLTDVAILSDMNKGIFAPIGR